MTTRPCAAANPAIALRLQSTRPAGRVAELGSLVATAHAMTRPLHVPIRFLVSGLFLIPLWYVMDSMSRWRSIEREVHLSLLEGAGAAVVVVFLFPVLRRGDRWQRVLAMMLLIILVFGLLDALLRALGAVFDFSL
jgi:hypothetical protein